MRTGVYATWCGFPWRGGFRPGRDGKRAADSWLRDKLAEVEAIRSGDPLPSTRRAAVTVAELIGEFLAFREANPDADPATTRKLRSQLRHAERAFGPVVVDDLGRLAIERWRFGLSGGARHYVFPAFRQVLAWGVANRLSTVNAATGIANPKRKRHERRPVVPFESWAEVLAVVDELDARYRAIPGVCCRDGPAA
jgi:hypothetical protein